MTITIYGIRNCDTMKKARRWLDARGVAYRFHDYRSDGIAEKQLTVWSRALGWEALLNRGGTTFRNLDATDKADLDESRSIALMLKHPSIIKRPLLALHDGTYLLGFKEDAYRLAFDARAAD